MRTLHATTAWIVAIVYLTLTLELGASHRHDKFHHSPWSHPPHLSHSSGLFHSAIALPYVTDTGHACEFPIPTMDAMDQDWSPGSAKNAAIAELDGHSGPGSAPDCPACWLEHHAQPALNAAPRFVLPIFPVSVVEAEYVNYRVAPWGRLFAAAHPARAPPPCIG